MPHATIEQQRKKKQAAQKRLKHLQQLLEQPLQPSRITPGRRVGFYGSLPGNLNSLVSTHQITNSNSQTITTPRSNTTTRRRRSSTQDFNPPPANQ